MGKGGNVAEWKLKVDAAYKEWKQDALHRKIKLCFTAANEQSKLPVVLRQKVEGDSPFKAHLSSLKETTYKEKVEDKKRKILSNGVELELSEDNSIEVRVSDT